MKNKKDFRTLKTFRKVINFKSRNISIKFFGITLYYFKKILLKKYSLR